MSIQLFPTTWQCCMWPLGGARVDTGLGRLDQWAPSTQLQETPWLVLGKAFQVWPTERGVLTLLAVTPHLGSVRKPNKFIGFTSTSVPSVNFYRTMPPFVIGTLGEGLMLPYVLPTLGKEF